MPEKSPSDVTSSFFMAWCNKLMQTVARNVDHLRYTYRRTRRMNDVMQARQANANVEVPKLALAQHTPSWQSGASACRGCFRTFTHVPNVRSSIPTTSGYEHIAINLFSIQCPHRFLDTEPEFWLTCAMSPGPAVDVFFSPDTRFGIVYDIWVLWHPT